MLHYIPFECDAIHTPSLSHAQYVTRPRFELGSLRSKRSALTIRLSGNVECGRECEFVCEPLAHFKLTPTPNLVPCNIIVIFAQLLTNRRKAKDVFGKAGKSKSLKIKLLKAKSKNFLESEFGQIIKSQFIQISIFLFSSKLPMLFIKK